MINSALQPHRILIIDDNHQWLQSLEPVGFKTLYCNKVSFRYIVNQLEACHREIQLVITNAQVKVVSGNNRADNYGDTLVKDLLKDRFPGLQFQMLSFIKGNDTNGQPYLNYIDFLNYVNSVSTHG